MPLFDNDDFYYWNQGTHVRPYDKMGAHPNQQGCWFGTWAPHATEVAVIGTFNDWNAEAHPMKRVDAGLWEVYVRGAKPGDAYKFRIARGGHAADKTDPYGFAMEAPASGGSFTEGLSSIITELDYEWSDSQWMDTREGPETLNKPVSVYEVHLGSWKHGDPGESLSYRSIAEPLATYVQDMGFTHVELMPVMEHPYYGSWGYQVVGFYAPTHRYGSPTDFKYLVDTLHQHGIGVILDWVPGHFAPDPQGLVYFDGSTLYEYEDPQMRYHPDWGTLVFDYNKPGVRNFLVGNALFWLDEYHIDGLRVDAVASMLYRDYSRGDQWSPNMFGGRENLEAIDFIKQMNETVFSHYPTAMTLAEESTAYPGVSAPTYDEGLGFLYKWNMGWMHDTLLYMSKDPVHRKYHHDSLTFSLVYAFSEQYLLPLSHDEVVHGKGSMWSKMPGDDWQKAANLRLVYGHMTGHPGKKLLFMGSEFGQYNEWNHNHSIDWHLLEKPLHAYVQQWVKDLLTLYHTHPALWDDSADGFEWIDFNDSTNSVLSYRRLNGDDELVFVLNLTPVPRENYRVGLPSEGRWEEVLNSDASVYGGGGMGNYGGVETTPVSYHDRPFSAVLTLPPLSMLILAPADTADTAEA